MVIRNNFVTLLDFVGVIDQFWFRHRDRRYSVVEAIMRGTVFDFGPEACHKFLFPPFARFSVDSVPHRGDQHDLFDGFVTAQFPKKTEVAIGRPSHSVVRDAMHVYDASQFDVSLVSVAR